MASNLIVARGGVEFVPPISLAFWRWTIVFIILFLFNYEKLIKKRKFVKKEFKKLFFLGAMGCGVCGAFPFLAGQTTTIINMGIIYTSSPIFIILISYFLFKEKFTILKFIGLVLCLIGVLLIIIKADINLLLSLKFTKGDLWMLGAAIGWALYSVYLFYWKSNLSVFERFTVISLCGALSLLPFYISEQILIQPTIFNNYFYMWTFFAAISPGIIAFSLYTYTQKYLGATTTGFTLYLFTVYGAFYGIILFNEKLEAYHYLSTLMVFLGIYLVKVNLFYNILSYFQILMLGMNIYWFKKLIKNNKFYIVNIWAAWCRPCREEHPKLMELSKNQNVQLIGINYRDNKKKAKQFIEDYGNPFSLIIYDKKGTVAIELGAYGIPETFIINKDKKIVKKYLGALTDQNLKEIYSTLK